MIESDSDIATALSIGDTLSFSDFTIQGFMSTNVYNLQSYDSPYDIEKQDFYVRVNTLDFINHGLVPGVQFTFTVRNLIYTFSIMNFFHDMVGWSKLNLNFVGVDYVY